LPILEDFTSLNADPDLRLPQLQATS